MDGETNRPADRAFWARRIFSFSGIAPLAVYVLWHLANNLYAVAGQRAFDARLEEATGSPLYRPALWLFVYLPFVVHTLVGLVVTWRAQPNLVRLPSFRNWKYVLQRVAAIGILLFLPAHVYKTRIAPRLHGYAIDFRHMQEGMREPITFAVYVLGMLGVCFHLANGLWLAGITWGLWTSPRGQRRGEVLSILFGLVLLAMAFTAIFALRR